MAFAQRGLWVLGTGTWLGLLVACGGGGDGGTEPTVGTPASIAKQGGDDQSAPAGTPVASPPSVVVRDAGGRAVGGVTVTFAVASGSGTVTGATATTTASGTAAVGSWILGTTAGPNTLTATVSGLAPVTFTATGIPGAAANVTKHTGDGQSATVASAVPTPPAVVVTDAHGNPVSGVTVSFAIASGGGSLTGASASTNASGIASVGNWTLGTTAGTNTVTATVGSLPPVTFTATGTPGPAATVTKTAGDNQSATVATAVTAAPRVRVDDTYGNPVPGVSVTFSVASGGGTVTGATVTTGASGEAAVGGWTLGTSAGPNTLSATVSGLSPVTFSATGTAGAPAVLAKMAGDNQSAKAGEAVSVPPKVRVTDAYGNAVGGVTVTFTVASGGGSISGAAPVTDTSGEASVGSWTLGPAPSGDVTNTLTATVSGISPVTFVATALDPCTVSSAYSLHTSISGTLATTDCQFVDGSFVDFYSTTVQPAQAVQFSLSSAQFDTYLLIQDSTGTVIAESDDVGTSTNSSLRILMTPGSYFIAANGFGPEDLGDYALSSTAASTTVTGCSLVFTTRRLLLTQHVTSSDCNASGYYYDEYIITLKAGQSVTITMNSTEIRPELALFDLSGNLVAYASGATGASFTYTPSTTQYFIIGAGAFDQFDTGQYTLDIQ